MPSFMTLSDGSLVSGAGPFRLVRHTYARTFSEIRTGAKLRATLRAGSSTDLGGYPLRLILSDGECICYPCARANLREITSAIRAHDSRGWRVVGCAVAWEGPDDYCAHCGEAMPTAYGDPDADESDD